MNDPTTPEGAKTTSTHAGSPWRPDSGRVAARQIAAWRLLGDLLTRARPTPGYMLPALAWSIGSGGGLTGHVPAADVLAGHGWSRRAVLDSWAAVADLPTPKRSSWLFAGDAEQPSDGMAFAIAAGTVHGVELRLMVTIYPYHPDRDHFADLPPLHPDPDQHTTTCGTDGTFGGVS